MKTRLLIVALLATSTFAVAAGAYTYRSQSYEAAVRADAGLPSRGPVDAKSADSAVRNYIHWTNIVGASPAPPGREVYARLGTKEGAQLCGGMTLAHVWALEQLGIMARYVGLGGNDFLSGHDQYQTHALAEVFYDGKWHISDPTFNVHVDCSDGEDRLSVSEAFACLARGEKLVSIPDGSVKAEFIQADYPRSYSDYFAAYEIHATAELPQFSWPSDGWLERSLAKYR